MGKKTKRRGSSKAGRPRKEGDRYPSGKLKPPAPNETTLQRRKAGDASAGEHPLDFALSNGWITEQMHRDGSAYRMAFNAAHRGAYGPRLALGSLAEVEESESLRMNWSQMSDAEIVDIFDRIFNQTAFIDHEKAEEAAMVRWKLLNMNLRPVEREELFMVCVLGSWPLWMPKRSAERALGSKDMCKEASLLDGLSAIRRTLRPQRRAAAIISAPFKRGRSGRAEQAVRCETQDGEPITPMSEHGAPFEVTILRKRA